MKRFNLKEDLQPWLFPDTGEIIDSRGLLIVGKNIISIENVYSQTFDLEQHGYSEEDIAKHSDSKEEKHTYGERSEITEFSKASQKRLIKACALWEPVGQQFFGTLTYPQTWPAPDVRRMQFKKFCDVLRKERPNWAGCWKLEYQRRGAPHYHFVFQNGARHMNLREENEYVANLWAKCIGEKAITEIEFPKNPQRAKYYLTKEVGKMVQTSVKQRNANDEYIQHKGRFWGWHNRGALQFKGDTYTLPSYVALMVREAIQAHVVQGLKRDGKIEIDTDGQARFKNTGRLLEPDMLPSFRLYDDGHYSFENCRQYIIEAHNVDIFDHMMRYTPPR